MMLRRIGASAFDFVLLLSYVSMIPNMVIWEQNAVVLNQYRIFWYFVICVMMCFLFLASRGATPGKMIFGLRVVNHDGAGINVLQSFLRPLFSIGGAWLLGPGLKASAFLNPEQRHWYDLYLGTKVISTRKQFPQAKAHKILGWSLILIITGFFIFSHYQTIKQISYNSGRLVYHE